MMARLSSGGGGPAPILFSTRNERLSACARFFTPFPDKVSHELRLTKVFSFLFDNVVPYAVVLIAPCVTSYDGKSQVLAADAHVGCDEDARVKTLAGCFWGFYALRFGLYTAYPTLVLSGACGARSDEASAASADDNCEASAWLSPRLSRGLNGETVWRNVPREYSVAWWVLYNSVTSVMRAAPAAIRNRDALDTYLRAYGAIDCVVPLFFFAALPRCCPRRGKGAMVPLFVERTESLRQLLEAATFVCFCISPLVTTEILIKARERAHAPADITLDKATGALLIGLTPPFFALSGLTVTAHAALPHDREAAYLQGPAQRENPYLEGGGSGSACTRGTAAALVLRAAGQGP